MRTSTVAFVVLFLCLASSADRRSAFREFLSDVKSGIHEVTREFRSESCGSDSGDSEARDLKRKLKDVDARYTAAGKTIRAVDRSIRQLRDRLTDLRDEMAHGYASRVVSNSVSVLSQQISELDSERQQIVDLQIALKNERVQIQSQLDLVSVRAERRQLEMMLERSPGNSPLDRMATAYEGR